MTERKSAVVLDVTWDDSDDTVHGPLQHPRKWDWADLTGETVEVRQWPDSDTAAVPPLPMPGEGFSDKVVVASVWVNDGYEDGPLSCLIIALNARPPFYSVIDLECSSVGSDWLILDSTEVQNINEATAEYSQRGGDI